MTRADRIYTTIATLIGLVSSLFGLHLYADQPDYSHPVRWSPDTAIVLDTDSYQFDAANLALASWVPALPKSASTSAHGNIQVLLLDPKDPKAGGEAVPKVEDRWITGCTIILDPKLLPELVLPALTHEMGHCLGLDHDYSKKPSIMYYDMGGWATGLFSFEMTEHDLSSMERLYSY